MQHVVLLALLAAVNTFHFGKVNFEPADALAYQVEGTTVVALTSYKIDRPALLAAIDPVNALYAQTADGGNFLVVYILSKERCAVAGFLGKTQQQLDLGSSFAAKNVATKDHIAGECWTKKPEKMFDDEYDFHLSYDVPITTIPKPTTLTAGGGEPGAQYLALVKAIQSNDWEVARARLRSDEVPPEKPSDLKQYFEGVSLNYPKTATVTGGQMKGDRARLDLKGVDHDGKKIKGAVALKKTGDVWRVMDQNFFLEE